MACKIRNLLIDICEKQGLKNIKNINNDNCKHQTLDNPTVTIIIPFVNLPIIYMVKIMNG